MRDLGLKTDSDKGRGEGGPASIGWGFLMNLDTSLHYSKVPVAQEHPSQQEETFGTVVDGDMSLPGQAPGH